MDIESFQTFIDVYQLQSFAEVAKRKNRAPSSITRSIALLEEQLGFRLFTRTTRKVTATEEGEKFFNRISNLLEEFESIKSEIAQGHSQPSGILRITTNVSFNQLFLTQLVPEFCRLYPYISLEIKSTDSYIDLIGERIDVAVRFGQLDDSSFLATKLFDLEYIVVASKAYIKEHGFPKRPEDLNKFSCLGLLLNQHHAQWKFRKGQKSINLKIDTKIKATGALPLIDYCEKNCGFSMLPKKMIEKQIKQGRLVQVLKSYQVTPTDFDSAAWLIYPAKEFLPARTRCFIDFIKSRI